MFSMDSWNSVHQRVSQNLWTSWWRHQIETFYTLLAICAGNSPLSGEFPTQRPVTLGFYVFFDLRLDKPFSKQWWGWCWKEVLIFSSSFAVKWTDAMDIFSVWVSSPPQFPHSCDDMNLWVLQWYGEYACSYNVWHLSRRPLMTAGLPIEHATTRIKINTANQVLLHLGLITVLRMFFN